MRIKQKDAVLKGCIFGKYMFIVFLCEIKSGFTAAFSQTSWTTLCQKVQNNTVNGRVPVNTTSNPN